MTTMRGALLVLGTVAALVGTTTFSDAGSFMPTGGRTTQPIGHYDFCQREAGECSQRTPRQAPTNLTRELWGKIVAVNNAVNAEVAPRTDLQMWGKEEFWSFPTSVGDCEDYALEKRRRLMAIGMPAGDLLMTVVRQPNGEGHAVLTVRTSHGDFILDNLETRVLAWTDTDYSYLKRQSERNSGAWVKIYDDRGAVAVGSVR